MFNPNYNSGMYITMKIYFSSHDEENTDSFSTQDLDRIMMKWSVEDVYDHEQELQTAQLIKRPYPSATWATTLSVMWAKCGI